MLGEVNYTPYYDKWVNIVLTYKNKEWKAYFNGEYICSLEDQNQFIAYNNILLGNGYTTRGIRPMKGDMMSCKIWNKELTQDEIKSINYITKTNNIQKDNIIKEMSFDTIEEIQAYGTISGANYEILPIE